MGGQAPGEVRLIGGMFKRSKLPVPDRPGLRPTPGRLRETLFNWLGRDLSGWRVLDAFAGTGALGFEAASRGATEVLLLERDAAVARGLQANAARLGATAVQVQCIDALAWLAGAPPRQFELILLDPPFDAALAEPAAAAAAPLIVAGGWLYVEAAAPLADAPAGFEPHRSLRVGAVSAQLFRKTA
jgi:16S rRNA (guanine(966)-N(2))-methyltransferase RsmD